MRVLAIDSAHAGAHNVLGQLNFEVCARPAAYRFIAARLFGMSLVRQASWQLAEIYLADAVRLDPSMIRYRMDLAKLLSRTGRDEEASRMLRAVGALPRIHPFDAALQSEAASLLATLAAKRGVNVNRTRTLRQPI